jgi:hypothetical protein
MFLGIDTQRGFDEAAAAYFEAVMVAGVPEERSRLIAEAYEAYMRVIQEAWASADLQDRARRTFEHYADTVGETWAPVTLSERASEAYRSYLRSLCETWAAVDYEAIDPATLAAIAQGMQTVAWSAGLSSAGTVPGPSGEGG